MSEVRAICYAKKMRRRNRGALLLEALLGMGIFLTALLLSFGVFPHSQRATAQARNHNLATAMARDFLEQELAKPYDSIASTPPFPQDRFFRSNSSADGAPVRIRFEVEIQASPAAVPAPLEGKVVRSIVRWVNGSSRKEVSYESWVTK